MPIDSKIAKFNSVFLFLVAGMCEIGGGGMVRQWLGERKGFPGVPSEESLT